MAFSKKKISWLAYDPAASAYALIVRTVFAPVFLAHFSQGILTGSQITSRWHKTYIRTCQEQYHSNVCITRPTIIFERFRFGSRRETT